jgi:2-polyprenyl-3-methyl-5-hydroxy-6-metoxy-1,4-benzoquinol methylase
MESQIMHDFAFKELDPEGMETLLAISQADSFNRWMYQTISPYLNGNILEVGSGIGNISKFFLDDHRNLTLSDIRDNYCTVLAQYFDREAYIKAIQQIDLVDENFREKQASVEGSFDSLFALNVLEHIKDDNLALFNASRLLKKDGTIVILVPAFRLLYNNLDKELHHYRRYSRSQLCSLLSQNGFSVSTSFYFNAAGIAGWFLSGSLFKRKLISPVQMSVFNRLVPLARFADLFMNRIAGLSVIAVAQKN